MCGIAEPHSAHEFAAGAMFSGGAQLLYACPGVPHRPTPVEPGLCWHDSGFGGFRCELRAGHAGAHEADRGSLGGSAVWLDEDAAS